MPLILGAGLVAAHENWDELRVWKGKTYISLWGIQRLTERPGQEFGGLKQRKREDVETEVARLQMGRHANGITGSL
jgi:hypothetical protein